MLGASGDEELASPSIFRRCVSLTWNIAKYPRINRRPGNGNKQGITTHIENSRLIRLTLSIDILGGRAWAWVRNFQGACSAQNIIPRATQSSQLANIKIQSFTNTGRGHEKMAADWSVGLLNALRAQCQ